MATKPALAVDNTLPPAVFGAIAAVMSDIGSEGITKSRTNQQQGYNFRGIDDVYNALNPIMARHGLVMLPNVLNWEKEERQTAKGGVLFYTTMHVEFTLAAAVDGSTVSIRTVGEAMDSADKSANKAMSAAYKYAAMQLFCIPTEGDNDADAHTPDVAPARREPPRETARQRAARETATNGGTHPNNAPRAVAAIVKDADAELDEIATQYPGAPELLLRLVQQVRQCQTTDDYNSWWAKAKAEAAELQGKDAYDLTQERAAAKARIAG